MTSDVSNTKDGIPLIYADALGNRGGTGVYVERLLRGLTILGEDVSVSIGGRFLPPHLALSAKPLSGPSKVLQESYILPLVSRWKHPSLVHLPAFSGRACPGVPVVVTLHDLAFCRNPSWFTGIRSIYYRMHFKRVAGRASALMVDSDFTAREAVDLLGVDRSVIRRVYLGTDNFQSNAGRFRDAFGITDDYLLFTGTIEPRKNIAALLDSWREIRGKHSGLKLVIAGRWGWGPESLRRRLETAEDVILTGRLSGEMLRSCVSGARILLYPSLYEGFGLPPLEAASAGVPSVVTPAGALLEIYGEVATVSSGFDGPSIARAVMESLDTKCDTDALQRFALRFSISAMTENVCAVYREFAE